MDAAKAEQILRDIQFETERKGPPDGFPKLPMLPKDRYTNPEFFALEMEHVFRKSWMFAAHKDELPEPGCFLRWDHSGVPIVIVHSQNGTLKAFYNTCRHRGAPVVREPSGKTTILRCGYHSWSYNLDGELVSLPDDRDFVDLDRSCNSLVPVRCETLGNLIFISQDPDAVPLLEFLSPFPEETREYLWDKLKLVEKQTIELECNWKIVMDAFLETYHLKHIHTNTVAHLLDHLGATMGLLPNGHSRMPTPVRPERIPDRMNNEGPLAIPWVGELPRVTNLAYNLFPNFVVPLEPMGFPLLIFWPNDLRNTTLEVVWLGADWGEGERPPEWDGLMYGFGAVLDEDTQFLPSIQKSMESPALEGIQLSYQERRIYHVHEEIDRLIGHANLPEGLALPPMLADYVERD